MRPGLQLSLTPLAGSKWLAGGEPPTNEKEKSEKSGQKREEGREKFKKERRQGRRLMKKGGKRQRVGEAGKEGRRDRRREGGREGGRMDTPNFEMWLRP